MSADAEALGNGRTMALDRVMGQMLIEEARLDDSSAEQLARVRNKVELADAILNGTEPIPEDYSDLRLAFTAASLLRERRRAEDRQAA